MSMKYNKEYKCSISNASSRFPDISKISKNNYYNHLGYFTRIRRIFTGDNCDDYYSMCIRFRSNFDAFTYIREEISTINTFYDNSFSEIYMYHHKISIKDYL